jgi:aspartyl-tRNA(Asn)/glutamyl-tRNA(Gln) amidotransferase subunit A
LFVPTTIVDAATALRAGGSTSRHLVDASLAAIERDAVATNAFILIDADGARASAASADEELAKGLDRGPLHGIPISVKDLIDVQGTVTTAGSRVLGDRVATTDAPVIERLRRAGAVLIGKTNLHEFALGTTSEDSAFGPVRHPADLRRVAGGSSGGSAVAVARGMGLASVGSDTGGSIRIPAAACGVVGLKPPFGDVPTAGVIPLSASLDHVGPLARSVQDAAWLWAVLAGRPPSRVARVDAGGLRLRRLVGYFDDPIEPAVRLALNRALDALTTAGATIEAWEVPGTDSIVDTYVNVVLAEAAHWHAPLLATRADDYIPRVRARFEMGRAVSAVAYLEAQHTREAHRLAVDAALDGCDALALPTLPIVAPLIGTDALSVDPAEPTEIPVRSAMLKHTQLFNMTGHPAITLPLPVDGLPVGLQLVGRDPVRLLAVAAACESILADREPS